MTKEDEEEKNSAENVFANAGFSAAESDPAQQPRHGASVANPRTTSCCIYGDDEVFISPHGSSPRGIVACRSCIGGAKAPNHPWA